MISVAGMITNVKSHFASPGIITTTLVATARKGSGMKAGQHAKHRQPLDKGSHRRAQN